MEDLRFRQIHMDFHTSEKIGGVGEKFEPEFFAETLSKAHVDSVTCFARCHHGMLYYDSKKFPERVHPGLGNKDLLIKQIDACRKKKIKVPVYTTIQWDYHISREHPEWVCLNADGSLVNFCRSGEPAKVYEAGFYKTLCVNTPYREYLKEHIRDLFEVLTPERIDGLFLDIVNIVDCSCKHCVEGMREKGYHPELKEERVAYARGMIAGFKKDMSAFIRGLRSDAQIFYNAGHINSASADAKEAYTHWELESLPSGLWGYSHFVNTVRFARTLGLDYLAQTGKFHTEWGDFHSFKNVEALQYECFRMLAYNARCLIGDQLNPDGEISAPVYELIGQVYGEVEKKEAWCKGARAITDIGVFTGECLCGHAGPGGSVPDEVNGVCAMLDEMGYQLDIVDDKNDFSNYKVLILPDQILCDEKLAEKIESYVSSGGKLIATAKSGLNKDETAFALDCLGVEYKGEAPYSPDFIVPTQQMGRNLPKTEHVMYQRGIHVGATKAQELAAAFIPYFNRTWEHFCSHRHTPSKHEKGYPGILKNKECIYFMHPIFSIYQKNHPKWCRELFRDALEMLLPDPVLAHNGPTSLVVTVNQQEKEERYILHALHYIPLKSSADLYTIEDIIPLYKVKVRLHLEKEIRSVRLVPQNIELTYKNVGGGIEIEIPEINGHTMIELSY